MVCVCVCRYEAQNWVGVFRSRQISEELRGGGWVVEMFEVGEYLNVSIISRYLPSSRQTNEGERKVHDMCSLTQRQ